MEAANSSKRSRASFDPVKLKQALVYYKRHENDTKPPVKKKLAKDFGVAYNTFKRHLKELNQKIARDRESGSFSEPIDYERYIPLVTFYGRKFEDEEERLVVDHLMHRWNYKKLVSQQLAVDTGSLVLLAKGSKPLVSKAWLQCVRKRYPVLEMANFNVGYSMISLEDLNAIRSWLNEYKSLLDTFKFGESQIWNMTEASFELGVVSKSWSKVWLDDDGKQAANFEKKEYMTVLETVSADGKALTPFLLYKGEDTSLSRYKPDNVPPFYYRSLQNGLLTSDIAIEWLEKLFIRETGVSENSSPTCLILEESNCFTSGKFRAKCKEYNIQVLYVPQRVSFLLQPLDQVLLSVISNEFRGGIFIDGKVPALDIDRGEFIISYDSVRSQRLKPQVLQYAWRMVGLFPYDRDRIFRSPKSSTDQNANLSINTTEDATVLSIGSHQNYTWTKAPDESDAQTSEALANERLSERPSLQEAQLGDILPNKLATGQSDTPLSKNTAEAYVPFTGLVTLKVSSDALNSLCVQNSKVIADAIEAPQFIVGAVNEINNEERGMADKTLAKDQIVQEVERIPHITVSAETPETSSKQGRTEAESGMIVSDNPLGKDIDAGLGKSTTMFPDTGKIDTAPNVALPEKPKISDKDRCGCADISVNNSNPYPHKIDGLVTTSFDGEAAEEYSRSMPRMPLADLLAKSASYRDDTPDVGMSVSAPSASKSAVQSTPYAAEKAPDANTQTRKSTVQDMEMHFMRQALRLDQNEDYVPQKEHTYKSFTGDMLPSNVPPTEDTSPKEIIEISSSESMEEEPTILDKATETMATPSNEPLLEQSPPQEFAETSNESRSVEPTTKENEESHNPSDNVPVTQNSEPLQVDHPDSAKTQPDEPKEVTESQLRKLQEDVEVWRLRALHNEVLFQTASRLFYEASKIGGYFMRPEEYNPEKKMLSADFMDSALRDLAQGQKSNQKHL
ncbi:hypothetical protein I9W82_000333 [Candida metapsilosis]|uniref:DDE-1 domain-containing protein n=1 Tax=Candida metapsilosis TaxID=273372 RepID=A0A8H7ZGC4_9ASCO|nr:hypothetical protein I9W82_000333 [Candida metapsilosis]